MHVNIEFVCSKNIELPIHYNHLVQAFIYKVIDEKMAIFLHEKGYGTGRSFKLFSFSNIIGQNYIDSEAGKIVFDSIVCLEISSPVVAFCESFANGLFKNLYSLKIMNWMYQV